MNEVKRNAAVVKALTHPARREVVRLMMKHDGKWAAEDSARALGAPVSSVAYHFRWLVGAEMITPTERVPSAGRLKQMYELSAHTRESDLIHGVLSATATEDHGA